MNKSFFIASAGLLCIVLVLAAGCTQPATPQATPTQTTVVTTAPPTPTPTSVSLTPGPTQTLRENWNIEVQVKSNGEAVDPQIITTVRGGKGLNFIQQIDVRVTRSDGVVEEDKMVRPMFVGKELSLKGTTQNKDRCEVWAVDPNNERVKIYDAYVPFRQF